jgi:hypothetical protein
MNGCRTFQEADLYELEKRRRVLLSSHCSNANTIETRSRISLSLLSFFITSAFSFAMCGLFFLCLFVWPADVPAARPQVCEGVRHRTDLAHRSLALPRAGNGTALRVCVPCPYLSVLMLGLNLYLYLYACVYASRSAGTQWRPKEENQCATGHHRPAGCRAARQGREAALHRNQVPIFPPPPPRSRRSAEYESSHRTDCTHSSTSSSRTLSSRRPSRTVARSARLRLVLS